MAVTSSPGRTTSRFGRTSRAAAYVRLTKPRIVELLVVTAVPAMFVAARGVPSGWLVLATVAGGALAAGGANAVNCYCDRDIDERMARTLGRPLPAGSLPAGAALRFGIALNVVAFAILWPAANLLAAGLALAATLYYVFVYTIALKRRTTMNIVIGGAAGAAPVLVGWAAVTGGLAAEAWVLFMIVFLWTPAHFWALAIRHRDDYAAAGVPMLPSVAGLPATTREILRYALLTVAVSLLFGAAARMGLVYLASAGVLGAFFVARAVALRREPGERRAMAVFGFSVTYLGLLFVSMAVDTLMHVP